MILCIGATPAVQRVMFFPRLEVGEVNRACRTLDGIGGKSVNVAKVLKTLGGDPVATGFIGGKRGSLLRAELASRGIEHEFIEVSPETRLCLTLLDETNGTQTELVEESQPVGESDYGGLTEVIQRRVTGCRAVIMSGTLTPNGPENFYARCTLLAHRAGALAVVDGRGPVLIQALEGHPALVKPNRAELAATVGREVRDEAQLRIGIEELRERGAERVIVTAGQESVIACEEFFGGCGHRESKRSTRSGPGMRLPRRWCGG